MGDGGFGDFGGTGGDGGFGGSGAAGDGGWDSEKKRKKKKKDKGGDFDSGWGGDGSAPGFGQGDDFGSSAPQGGDFGGGGGGGVGGDSHTGGGHFGSTSDGGFGGGFDAGMPPTLGSTMQESQLDRLAQDRQGLDGKAIKGDPIGSFKAVIAADREVLQQLRREVEELGDIVRREQDEGRDLQNQVRETQDEGHRLSDQEQHLMHGLNSAKGKLTAVREDVRRELLVARQGAETRLQVAMGEQHNVNLDNLHLQFDLQHVAQELEFLQRKLEDDKRTCDFFAEANRLLHMHNDELDTQLEHLKQERKHLSEEAVKEKDQVKGEERQLAELRNKVAQLRRSKLAAHHELKEAQSREQMMREMKGGTPQVAASPSGVQAPQRQAPAVAHSWAQHVYTPTGPHGANQPARGVPGGMQAPGAGIHF